MKAEEAMACECSLGFGLQYRASGLGRLLAKRIVLLRRSFCWAHTFSSIRGNQHARYVRPSSRQCDYRLDHCGSRARHTWQPLLLPSIPQFNNPHPHSDIEGTLHHVHRSQLTTHHVRSLLRLLPSASRRARRNVDQVWGPGDTRQRALLLYRGERLAVGGSCGRGDCEKRQ